MLIEIDGRCILTYPVWSDRISPVSFAGPKRFYKPPIQIDSLPKMDSVLISHDHSDHVDKATILTLANRDTKYFM